MKPKAPVKVGDYRVESMGGIWFLTDGRGRIRATFFDNGGGVWRGVAPGGRVLEEPIGDDVADPHLVMARRLCRE